MAIADDRSTILRRRARFVGSALLAATACGGAQRPASPSGAAIEVPEAREGSEAPERPKAAEPRAEQGLPPLDVPEHVEGIAKMMYESLAQRVPPLHQAIDKLRAQKPALCDLNDPGCEQRWAQIASGIEELAGDVSTLGSKCPGSSAEAKRFEARVEQHQRYALARLAALDREIAHSFADAASRWQALRAAAVRAAPMACLDCSDW